MKIEKMNLYEILHYLAQNFNSETTNLYIRCLDCDEFIPIIEWENQNSFIEFEICDNCIQDKED